MDNGAMNGDGNGKVYLEWAEGGGRIERGRQRSMVDEKAYVGRGCVGVPEFLRGGGCRLGSAPTTFVTKKTGG